MKKVRGRGWIGRERGKGWPCRWWWFWRGKGRGRASSSFFYSALVIGSNKRSSRSKKTRNDNYVCDSDTDFMKIIGPGDLSNLSYNDSKRKIC